MDPELKIYTQDHSWAGSIVVVAKSEADARKLMIQCTNYEAGEPIQESPITEGFVFYNLGDS